MTRQGGPKSPIAEPKATGKATRKKKPTPLPPVVVEPPPPPPPPAEPALAIEMAIGGQTYFKVIEELTDGRTTIPVIGALRVLVDGHSQGKGAEVIFANDIAMGAEGGTVSFGRIAIHFNGAKVFEHGPLTQHQCQVWRQAVGQARPRPARDIPALVRAGAVPPYAMGAVPIHQPGADWKPILGVNGIRQDMSNTGGRQDIGPTTMGCAIWLMADTGEAYALGQADVAGSIPWHYYDPVHGRYLCLDDYPELWIDGRGSVRPPQLGGPDTGWSCEHAHHPDLSFIPWLLTGEPYHLDMLNAQASWAIASVINGWGRTDELGRTGIVIGTSVQLRAAAWILRDVENAAYANPPGSREREYFRRIADNNWEHVAELLQLWTDQQGETYGRMPGYGDADRHSPWQQDYMASTVGMAAIRGNPDARRVLRWMSNMILGRFERLPEKRAGFAFQLTIGRTWDQVVVDQGAGGNYADLAAMSLAYLILVFRDGDVVERTIAARATTARDWILNESGDPNLGGEPQNQVVPA